MKEPAPIICHLPCICIDAGRTSHIATWRGILYDPAQRCPVEAKVHKISSSCPPAHWPALTHTGDLSACDIPLRSAMPPLMLWI